MKRIFQDSSSIPVLVSEDGKVLTDGNYILYFDSGDEIWVYANAQGELGQAVIGTWGQKTAVINISQQAGPPNNFEVSYQGLTSTCVDGILTPEPDLYTE